MKNKLDAKALLVHEEKKKRRAAVAKEVERRKAIEETVEDLYGWVDEIHCELRDAKSKVKAATQETNAANVAKSKIATVASNRLALIKTLKQQLRDTKDDLAEESHERASLEKLRQIQVQIKRERQVGRKGGAARWPVHIVLLICELLVDGVPPSAVPATLQTTSSALLGVEAEELPTIGFVRNCRVVLQNINETLAAFRLGNATTWHQLFTDGTSRRQIAMQNLVIGLMEEGKLDPVIVSSCQFVKNETAEACAESIVETVSIFSCVYYIYFIYDCNNINIRRHVIHHLFSHCSYRI